MRGFSACVVRQSRLYTRQNVVFFFVYEVREQVTDVLRPTKRDPVLKARIALNIAIVNACRSFGEAQWTNGYRAGKFPVGYSELYLKEAKCWKAHGDDCRNVERLLTAFQRVAQRSKAVK